LLAEGRFSHYITMAGAMGADCGPGAASSSENTKPQSEPARQSFFFQPSFSGAEREAA